MKGVEARARSIRVFFWYQNRQCKEVLYVDGVYLSPTPANLLYATRFVAGIDKKIRNGTFDYGATFPESKKVPKSTSLNGDELFVDLIDRWFSLLDLKPSTRQQYRRHKDLFWKVHLPNKPIKQFVHSDIKKALQQGKWKSNKSRNNQLSLIRGVFQLAVLDKQISHNPCEGLLYATVQTKKPDPFSQAEVQLILNSLAEQYDAPIFNFVQFQFYTGLRTSEAIALEWSCVDLLRKEILVDRANVYGEEQGSTKTMVARKVRLNSEAVIALERQKAFTFGECDKVFNDPRTEAPWKYHDITDSAHWPITLKRLGLRHRRPYNTRHTYATLALMAGVNPAYMARQMGHSLEVFFKVYADWIDGEGDEREIAKLENAIKKTIPVLSQSAKKKP